MQQQPLQHENSQITNTNTPTINTSNTLTPQITSTRGTHSNNVLTTTTPTISTQHSGPQSPSIIVGLAAWVPPAGAGVGAAASEIIATPVLNTKASTIPQVTGTVDAFTSATSALPSSQYHNSSAASAVPVVTISSLLTPDPRTEELLGALTIDQLSLIEKTVQRVKRKKAKESKRLNSSNEITANDNTNIANLVANINAVNNGSTKQNAQNMTSNSISNSTAISPVTFINKDHHHYQSIHENQQIRSHHNQQQQQINLQQHQFYTPQQFKQPSQISITDKPRQSLNPISPRKPDTPISNPTPNHALPATDPVIEECDGISWVVFTYSVKGNNKEYRIRIDIDKIDLNDIEESFKRDNCLYPRANCTEDKYKGNRWSYENECNSLGWKLSWLNQEEIGGKRGLLQRAVDSYRNRDPMLRSRRVVRNEKILNGTLRKRVTRDGEGYDVNDGSAKRQKGVAKQLTLEVPEKGISTKIRIRVDIDTVDLISIPEEFKKNNCAFPKANVPKNEYQGNKYELETAWNELGWKLAFLNQSKLDGKRSLLLKAIELYQSKYNTELRPKRGRYSHTLSAKFFENHPRGVVTSNSVTQTISSVNDNEITMPTMTTEANLNEISTTIPFDTVSNGTSPKELTEGSTNIDNMDE
ncbi:hypothetical protein RhiirA1_415925 [Rhizophagus irregularis]|uniref:DUF8032 domain-containing protein n=1 Tax=Rhizophagus irregularis TaxID=588596 RepID=A0A2I1E8U8_9GLOM|nr:hypothetical protein RhiirA1_415925 [Rhizophagus irregularis]PKY18562.1 hypothetical protein RhiirB3_405727 [Rhizophagus irregularis]CAB4482153.1 unnamed protein product [Rhizophagus irregularis]CAB5300063.1 unnamed protein product [Rhizophagus irregularis]